MPEIIYGWVTLVEAETYMAARLGSSKYWNTNTSKIAALTTAYNFLIVSSYDFPIEVSTNMKNAQCEMALFLLQHLEDMDARMGLQAQGVVSAGVVEESYREDATGEMPIPATVKKLLSVYETDKGMQVSDIERDDNEDVI